ncbi:unnamed protein product [Calicophoron daubneyi]|uniref:Uncharacterized protein n=1 Tax=Calicophoron daubneyi TaxID=300641 RepID=A0AAV2TBW2_CALDB
MSLSSAADDIDSCIHSMQDLVVEEQKLESTNQNLVTYLSRRLEYEVLRDIIFDLAYDVELGFSSPRDAEFYGILSAAWSKAHLRVSGKRDTGIPIEQPNYCLSKQQASLLFCRVDEKIDDNQELLNISVNGSSSEILKLKLEKHKLSTRSGKNQCTVAETISRIFTVTSDLFRVIRSNVIPKANLMVASVLLSEAEGLLAQVSSLEHSCLQDALKSSTMLTHLRQKRNELNSTVVQLSKEVADLERTLSAYRDRDAEYQDIVKQFNACQRQLALRSQMLKSTNFRRQGTPSGRRSLSFDSLTKSSNSTHPSM